MYELLKSIKYEILDALTIVIKQSLHQGIFPNKLKLAEVIPLHKKKDQACVDNYRPISLLPSIKKKIEKNVFNQLSAYFSSNKLLFLRQYGFRADHSTELATIELVDKITHKLDKGELPLVLFLDLCKAFDTLNHEILLTKLGHYQFQ